MEEYVIGDWTTNEDRSRVKDFTEEQAQERMYELAAFREKLTKVIHELDSQNEKYIKEARAILENFPGLRLGVKK
jgi:hypothetical protein